MITVPKKLWWRLGIIILAVIVFTGGYYFRTWVEENIEYRIVSVNTTTEVTSSITDRWELQLTDRTNGKVKVYDKDVLDAIYYQYQARRSYTHEDRKPGP
jgi:hypothetical protein